jgi:hypothetical protein
MLLASLANHSPTEIYGCEHGRRFTGKTIQLAFRGSVLQ